MPLNNNNNQEEIKTEEEKEKEQLEWQYQQVQTFEDLKKLVFFHRHRGTDTLRIKYSDLEGVGSSSGGTNLRAIKSISAGYQSVNSGVWTKITFNDVEWDENNEWDKNNSKFVVPQTGYYLISASLGVNNPTAGHMYTIGIWKNNGEVRGCTIHSNSTYNITPQVVDILKLTKDDYIEIYFYHDTGQAVQIQYNTYNTWVTIKKI